MSEAQHTEYKHHWKDDLLKWRCAFANAEGGTLMVGYNDHGCAVGMEQTEKLLDKHASHTHNPDIANAFFRAAYLAPAFAAGLIEMTNPEKPNSRLQEYRLTEASRPLQAMLKAEDGV